MLLLGTGKVSNSSTILAFDMLLLAVGASGSELNPALRSFNNLYGLAAQSVNRVARLSGPIISNMPSLVCKSFD